MFKNDKETHDWSVSQVLDLANEMLQEKKRERRSRLLFRVFIFAMIAISFYSVISMTPSTEHVPDRQAHVAVVDLNGPIMSGADASASAVIDSLNEAFGNPASQAVIIHANSPGGTPVQAAYIYDEIMRLKTANPNKPIYGVVQDVCASGCYYALAATDRIIVNGSSLVGSIGVRMDGFGFTGLMEKLGVEQRLITAGEHKAMMNPFAAEDEQSRAHMQALLNQTHQQFIQAVKNGRGDRLSNNPDLFSGLVWNGDESVKLGLADGQGDIRFVAREMLKNEELVNYTYQKDFFERLSQTISQDITQSVLMNWRQMH